MYSLNITIHGDFEFPQTDLLFFFHIISVEKYDLCIRIITIQILKLWLNRELPYSQLLLLLLN